MNYFFDWDAKKAKQNLLKHKISFERATQIFKDPLAISIFDEEHSDNEERWITLGKDKNNVLLVVIHTFIEYKNNECRIRLISARKTTKNEVKKYEEL